MKGKKGKKVLVLMLVLLAAGGGAGAAWALRPHSASAHKQPAAPAPVSASLAEVTTNLADAGQQRFVQVAMTLELDGPAAAKTFNDKLPAVQDAVIGVLRSRTSQEMAGAEGMRKLGADLKTVVDGVLGGKHVLQIYFTHLVIQ